MNLEPNWQNLRRIVLFVTVFATAGLAGAFSARFKTFPYAQLLERPFVALKARKLLSESPESVYKTDLWKPSRTPSGVVRHDPSQTFDGYTFFTSADIQGARLVDMDGEVVHEWRLPFDEAWSDPAHVDTVPPASHVYWRRGHLFPNGDVIALYTTVAGSLTCCGMVKVDKNSEVLWRYGESVHHDLDVAEDGSIYTLVHGSRSTSHRPVPNLPQYPQIISDEYLVKLSADGREQKRINLLDLLARSDFRGLLQMYDRRPANPVRGERRWDILHANAVEILEASFARAHAFAEPGQILVSFRSPDAIVLIDLEHEKVVWGTRGFWRAQHDPDALANGEILIFDNRGHAGPGGESRIIRFQPGHGKITWNYSGSSTRPFRSHIFGSQQYLPNGNVLVTSSERGRIFEVTEDGQVVWDFRHLTRRPNEARTFRAAVFGARRISPSGIAFEFTR